MTNNYMQERLSLKRHNERLAALDKAIGISHNTPPKTHIPQTNYYPTGKYLKSSSLSLMTTDKYIVSLFKKDSVSDQVLTATEINDASLAVCVYVDKEAILDIFEVSEITPELLNNVELRINHLAKLSYCDQYIIPANEHLYLGDI